MINMKNYFQECGCVVYYMPRISQKTKICNRVNSKCYNSVRISLERGDNKEYQCHCLPGCDELCFSGEVSVAPLTITKFNVRNQLENFSDEEIR